MGEKVILGGLSDAATRSLIKAIREGTAPLAAALANSLANPETTPPAPGPVTPAPLAETDPLGLTGEPWQRVTTEQSGVDRHTPVGRTVVAFLDDNGTLRWVTTDRLDGVPAGWRPVLLGPAVLPRTERLS